MPTEDTTRRTPELRVLHVEDDALDAELVARSVRTNGLVVSVVVVRNEAEFTRQLLTREVLTRKPDIVLAGYRLPQWRGMGALDVIRREGLDIPLVIVSGALGDVGAVECIKQGATDYVLKDGLARLPDVIRRALDEKRLLRSRKEAEEALARETEELTRSNADLEQFAYVASHDLQEPLRMVASYTQLLAERYGGKLDETADKYIQYASEGALRMQQLIHDLLAFSRVGRAGATSGNVDCNTVMEDVAQSLTAALQESGASLIYEALPVVWAEGPLVTQVF